MKTVFSRDQFTATQWDTAEDKAKFANHFLAFVESGFAEPKFPKWFYKRLSMTFGHIAHYDQGGFFAEFFTTTKDRVRFIEQTLQYPGYGDPKFTYCDVEKALQDALRKMNVLEKVRAEHAGAVENAERAELSRLKAKYEGAQPCP